MKRTFLVGMVLSAVLPARAWSADGGLNQPTTGYIACPGGLYHCGELGTTPHSGKLPVYCTQAAMNQQASDISRYQGIIGQIINDQTAVANKVNQMATAYAHYPQKATYFSDTYKSLSNGLIAGYITPIKSDLDKASSCIWDPQWVVSNDGCHLVDLSCYDRYSIQYRITQLPNLFDEFIQDVEANGNMLVSGLPTGCMRSWNGICYKWCDSSTPPCQQHMIAALSGIVQAEQALKSEAHY